MKLPLDVFDTNGSYEKNRRVSLSVLSALSATGVFADYDRKVTEHPLAHRDLF
ncbi:hypothetical protein [Parasedimentitalea denitrificans]|uniref:hypothetical protein n=1 Tax=Parasedimentitalea denitrificans TaxID=2211118 RepID=UPI00142F7575|nr:hypothetical protein [Sedimentitalea sp. CY04]